MPIEYEIVVSGEEGGILTFYVMDSKIIPAMQKINPKIKLTKLSDLEYDTDQNLPSQD